MKPANEFETCARGAVLKEKLNTTRTRSWRRRYRSVGSSALTQRSGELCARSLPHTRTGRAPRRRTGSRPGARGASPAPAPRHAEPPHAPAPPNPAKGSLFGGAHLRGAVRPPRCLYGGVNNNRLRYNLASENHLQVLSTPSIVREQKKS